MSHGCFNRAPLQTAVWHQDGWLKSQTELGKVTRLPRMVQRPDPMSKNCNYQQHDKYADPGCVGCKHKDINE